MVKIEKADRRSKRTRQMLGSALTELMLEKQYDAITVQDILDRANVGRSTFYAHYSDKEDLLMSEIERVIHLLAGYTAHSGHGQGRLLPSLEFFRHVQEQRRLVQAFIWGRGAEMLMRDFQIQVSKAVEQNLHSLTGQESADSIPLSVLANFVASTFLMLLRWWFEDDLRYSPEQMEAMFQKLVMPSLHALMSESSA